MDSQNLRYVGETYALEFPSDRPYVYLQSPEGRRIVALFVLSSLHPLRGRDDTTWAGAWIAEEADGSTVYTLEAKSSVWDRKVFTLKCSPRRFSYDITIEGEGRLAEVLYFGGYSSARPRFGSGFFPSGHTFQRGFNPEPNADNQPYFEPAGGTVIDLVGGPLPGKRHWFFTPAPFCYCFETKDGWLAAGVEAEPGENTFTAYRYHGGSGFHLSLDYEGYTEVRGRYRLPAIAFDFAPTEYDALAAHVSSLRTAGKAPVPTADQADWWWESIFCGWGAQCALAARRQGYGGADPADPQPQAFLSTMRAAADYARQDVYEDFVRTLAEHDLHPGTITIDDKWQETYGGNRADPDKWPDLRGFVDARHREGQHVLLWLKAWDIEGLPAEKCISNAAGVPLTVDPTNPVYEARLRESVSHMLSSDGYDADGFKIDFSHRIPSGPGFSHHGREWGLELMKCLLWIIHDEAKRVKRDALVITHTPNPYLADVLDMVRLNDMLDLSPLVDGEAVKHIGPVLMHRARVARIACPEAPIDTDNWPVRNREFWREYIRLQPSIGVPSLYFVSTIDLTQEVLTEEDYRLVGETWKHSRRK